VTVRVSWGSCFRIIAAHLPRIDIFEQVTDPADLDAVLKIEALTNPRMLELHEAIRNVEVDDRITGPGSTFVMAPFAYARPSRFTDGTFGVYYAADAVETAIEEHKHHRTAFLADTDEPPGVFDHRVIEAALEATLTDVARESHVAELLHPMDYRASQAFGSAVHAARGDGMVWPSVRHAGGTCVGILKPRLISNARSAYYLGYRWDGTSVYDVFRMESLTGAYPVEPPTR
jgi:RES domain